MNEIELSPIRKPVRIPRAKQEAEQVPEGIESDTPNKIDLGFEIDRSKVYVFETIKKATAHRNENLGSRCKAYDIVEKRYRDIGYLPIAPSIFIEDWHESLVERPQEPLIFYRNEITVSGEDIRLMEYMLNHPLYEHSPFRVYNRPAMFYLADKDVMEQINAKRHATELKALQVIADTPIPDLRPIARIIFGVMEKSDTGIVNAMNDLAKKPKVGLEKTSNAERILENINSPKIIRTYNIQNAIDTGIITINQNTMEARLTSGNIFLLKLQSKKYLDELLDWSFTDEGKKAYNLIKQKI